MEKEVPKAIVKSPKSKSVRIGRGFSPAELKAVGLSIEEARRIGLYVDSRRRSAKMDNVNVLKEFLEKMRKTGKENGS